MNNALAFLLAFLLAGPAVAQVQQSGNVTPGHPAMWATTGVIQDGGSVSTPALTNVGVLNSGLGICDQNLPTSGSYVQLCLGFVGGVPTIFANGPGMGSLLNFNINGVTTSFGPAGPYLPLTGGTVSGTLGVTGALNLAHNQNTINVIDSGAVGNGTTDDTAAIQAAATACPAAGCTLYFPPGYTFGVSGTVFLKSNTYVVGYGATMVALAQLSGPAGRTYPSGAFLENMNWSATTLTDHDITVEGITLDGGASLGGGHFIQTDFVSRPQVINVTGYGRGPTTTATGTYTVSGGVVASVALSTGGAGYYLNETVQGALGFPSGGGSGAAGSVTISGGVATGLALTSGGSGYSTPGTYPLQIYTGGGDFIAMIGTADSLIQGSSGYYFVNATYDHWWAPKNARMIGNYALLDFAAQAVNFNPEPTSGATSGLVANGFTMTGNTIVSTAPTAVPMQIEPLGGTGTSETNIVITGNLFSNVSLVSRRAVQGETITGNVFANVAGGVTNIVSYPLGGSIPDAITVSGNTFINPTTNANAEAVIWVQGTNSAIVGNTISGTPGGCYGATQTGGYPVVIDGNNGWSNCTYGNTGSAWVVDGELPLAGAGKYFLLTQGTPTAAGFSNVLQMVFSEARNSDGTAMATTPSAGKFGLGWGPGQNQLFHSETANNSVITDTAGWEFTLPASYIPGSNITLTSWCYYVLGSGTVGTHTLEMDAYSIGGSSGIGGGLSSNLIATAPQTVPESAAPANLTFTITGTGLYPGERILLVPKMILQATTAQNILGYIFSAQLQ